MARPRTVPSELYCSTCQSTFARREHYQRHLRTHTKEKPFACTWCGQKFGRGDSLTRHCVTVHQHAGIDGSTGSVSGRRRVIQACTQCSQSKLRCDGNQPCGRCHVQQSHCHYYPSKRASKPEVDNNVSAKRPKVSGVAGLAEVLNQDHLPGSEWHTIPSGPVRTQNPGLGGSSLAQRYPHYTAHSDGGTTSAMDTTQALSLPDDDLNDFTSWFSLPVDHALPLDLASHDLDFSTLDMVRPSVMEELPLQEPSDFQPRNAALPPSDITELYKRNQLPEMDKDAVEPRHYDPSCAEVDAQLIFPDMNAVPIKDVEAENLAHVEEVPAELTDIVFQLASQMQLNSNYPQFIELSIPPAHVLNAWVQLYFEHFHPIFPVLHKPTFSTSGTNPFLVFTVAAIGAHFSELKGANACLKAMHELIRRYTSYTCEKWNKNSRELWMTQTILLNQLGLMYSGDRRALELAELFQAVPVTLGRRKRLFINTLPQERLCQLTLSLEEKWHVSSLDEQRRRAGFAIWLIDTAYDYNFGLCTTMRVDELRDCLPQSESRWSASSAQNWATFGEGNGLETHTTLGQVIQKRRWNSVWSKTGTLGKQTILQYLTNIVKDKGDLSPGSPTFSLEERNEAMKVLEGLLEETRDECYGYSLSEVKASAIHRVMILSALTNYHTPTSDIVSHAIKAIYGKMDESSWTQIIDQWSDSPCQGRLAVLYAVHVFETIRSARCTHFMTPVHFLRAALVLWLYATIYDRLRQGCEYQFQVPMVVLDFKSLNTTATKQWITNGSSCIKLAGISNLLNIKGRCKILEDSVVIMRSLKAWGISTMYAQILARLLHAENMRTA